MIWRRRQHYWRANRQMRLIIVSQGIWMTLLVAFFAWWGHLLGEQGERIAELEANSGVPTELVTENLDRLNRIIFWEAGSIIALVSIVSGVLIWMYFRDSRRSRSVQTFFAGVTHELRTPMAGIRLQAESISEKIADDDPIRKLANRLLEDASQLEGHVEQTLELARVEGGEPPQLQDINLAECFEQFRRQWYYTHGEDRPQVNCELGDLVCLADPAAMQTIFRNLFDNSLRHSGKEDVCVSLTARRQGGRVQLVYRDNGEGFSQDAESLGKVFHKGPTSTGSGVGLYLVSALMRKMGGAVEFSADRGFVAMMELNAGGGDGN
ncbi:MAG: HAMP domain-containing histidine kinase [Gammaproteobacteria bacterium]|nr:HAMP domain-containing histidine kinase [Gammaproteobacteria bacterium]